MNLEHLPTSSRATAESVFVSDKPFQPHTDQAARSDSVVSHRRLWWNNFKKHRVAYVAFWFLVTMYACLPWIEWIAPYGLQTRHSQYAHQPPQSIHWFHESQWVGPFVYGYHASLNPDTFRREFTVDRNKIYPIKFLCRGEPYEWLGVVKSDWHLFCPSPGGTLFVLGTDRLGRDLLSRILYGARISLTIGILGITVSFLLGMTLGAMAGYYGGWVDFIIQRSIEIFRCFPEIPLWMTLAAIMPPTWKPLTVYFGITIILGLLDWPALARSVRSKLLSLREEEYCKAAELMGASPSRLMRRHLLPGFSSHLIASATLTIPGMILGETALSYLGLGLRPPITSWGVLLNEARNINDVLLNPWLLLPVVPVMLTVLAFNFLGDGLRDAADPYHHPQS